jgi:hypothetical protein
MPEITYILVLPGGISWIAEVSPFGYLAAARSAAPDGPKWTKCDELEAWYLEPNQVTPSAPGAPLLWTDKIVPLTRKQYLLMLTIYGKTSTIGDNV